MSRQIQVHYKFELIWNYLKWNDIGQRTSTVIHAKDAAKKKEILRVLSSKSRKRMKCTLQEINKGKTKVRPFTWSLSSKSGDEEGATGKRCIHWISGSEEGKGGQTPPWRRYKQESRKRTGRDYSDFETLWFTKRNCMFNLPRSTYCNQPVIFCV